MIETTILQVVKRKCKVWVIKENKNNEAIGFATIYGVPYKAKDLPIGSTFTTILYVPEKQKARKR